MPSLWKREKSPYWICCFTNADGQRLKKSTKVTIKPLKGEKNKDGSPKTVADKRIEAWEFCLSIERAERSAKNGTLTEQAAKKIIGEIVERSTGEPLHSASVCEWFDEWLEGKAQTKSAATAERYKQVKQDFLESLCNRARLSLAHISPKDIRNYRDGELAAGKSPKTANLSVKSLPARLHHEQPLQGAGKFGRRNSGTFCIHPCANRESGQSSERRLERRDPACLFQRRTASRRGEYALDRN
jgi:hypothetical protein